MKKGFTLIELLVVVLIIGILAAIALPQYTTAVEKSRSAEAVSMMGTIRYAGERYRLQNGYFPSSLDVLDIEVPATTKNFKFEVSGGSAEAKTTPMIITATRDGELYVLSTVVSTDGTAKRYCAAAAGTAEAAPSAPSGETLKLCNAITSGQSVSGEW